MLINYRTLGLPNDEYQNNYDDNDELSMIASTIDVT